MLLSLVWTCVGLLLVSHVLPCAADDGLAFDFNVTDCNATDGCNKSASLREREYENESESENVSVCGNVNNDSTCVEKEPEKAKASSECSVCGDDAYDAYRCAIPNRTLCIPIDYSDAAVNTSQSSTGLIFHQLATQSSGNVFVENLFDETETSNLLLLKNNKDDRDLLITRKSGLSVRVKISEVKLVPELEDQNFDSDNVFMMTSKKGSLTSEQKKFDQIAKSFCRHPMPDYYSLTLQLYRDRTTLINEELCDSTNPVHKICPQSLIDGVDSIRYRSLNEPCPKSRLVPQRLYEDSNSILCTDNVPLLTDLFNRSLSPERLEVPTSRAMDCKSAEADCERCTSASENYNALSCANVGLNATSCASCGLARCYAQSQCRRSMQPSCAEVLPVCARGDVARVTLQPVFATIDSEFRCPLRFVHTTRSSHLVTLFRLTHSLELAHHAFRTEPRHETAQVPLSASALFANSGSVVLGLFEVDYDAKLAALAALNSSVDFLVVGKVEDVQANETKYRLQFDRVKSASKWSRQPVVVTDNRLSVALVQPRRPFGISSSTWAKRYQHCQHDVSELYAQQDVTDDQESMAINASGISIEPISEPSLTGEDLGATFRYSLMSKASPPSIAVRLPAKRSVLQQFYSEQGEILQSDSQNLSAVLQFDANASIFNLTIAGRLKRAGLLRLQLTEWYTNTTVLQSDILVLATSSNASANANQSQTQTQTQTQSQPHFTVSNIFRLKSNSSVSQQEEKYVFQLELTDFTVRHVIKLIYDAAAHSLLSREDFSGDSNSSILLNPADSPLKHEKTPGQEAFRMLSDELIEFLLNWTASVNLVVLVAGLTAAYFVLISIHCGLRYCRRFNALSLGYYPTSTKPATQLSIIVDANESSINAISLYGRKRQDSESGSMEETGLTSPCRNQLSKQQVRRHGARIVALSIVVLTRLIHHIVFNLSIFFTVFLYLNQSNLSIVESALFSPNLMTNSTSKKLSLTELGAEFGHLSRLSTMCNARLDNMAENLRFHAANAADYHLTQLFNTDSVSNSAEVNTFQVLKALESQLSSTLSKHRAQLDSFMMYYKYTVLPIQLGKQYAIFNKLLHKLYHSNWLQFAQHIFNQTSASSSNGEFSRNFARLKKMYDEDDVSHLRSLLFKQEYVQFSNMLEVFEVEQLMFAPVQLMRAFETRRPQYPELDLLPPRRLSEIINTAILSIDSTRQKSLSLSPSPSPQSQTQSFTVKLTTETKMSRREDAEESSKTSQGSIDSGNIVQQLKSLRIALLLFDLALFGARITLTVNLAKSLWAGLPVALADPAASKLLGICLYKKKRIKSRLRSTRLETSSLSDACNLFRKVWFAHLNVKRAMIIGICISIAFTFEAVTEFDARVAQSSENSTLDRSLSMNVRKQAIVLNDAITTVLARREKMKARNKVERMQQFTNQFNLQQWKTLADYQTVGCNLAHANNTVKNDPRCLQSVKKQQLLNTDYISGCTFLMQRPESISLANLPINDLAEVKNRETVRIALLRLVRSLLLVTIVGVSIAELFCDYFFQLFLDIAMVRLRSDNVATILNCSIIPQDDQQKHSPADQSSSFCRDKDEVEMTEQAVTSCSNSPQQLQIDWPQKNGCSQQNQNGDSAPDQTQSRV